MADTLRPVFVHYICYFKRCQLSSFFTETSRAFFSSESTWHTFSRNPSYRLFSLLLVPLEESSLLWPQHLNSPELVKMTGHGTCSSVVIHKQQCLLYRRWPLGGVCAVAYSSALALLRELKFSVKKEAKYPGFICDSDIKSKSQRFLLTPSSFYSGVLVADLAFIADCCSK